MSFLNSPIQLFENEFNTQYASGSNGNNKSLLNKKSMESIRLNSPRIRFDLPDLSIESDKQGVGVVGKKSFNSFLNKMGKNNSSRTRDTPPTPILIPFQNYDSPSSSLSPKNQTRPLPPIPKIESKIIIRPSPAPITPIKPILKKQQASLPIGEEGEKRVSLDSEESYLCPFSSFPMPYQSNFGLLSPPMSRDNSLQNDQSPKFSKRPLEISPIFNFKKVTTLNRNESSSPGLNRTGSSERNLLTNSSSKNRSQSEGDKKMNSSRISYEDGTGFPCNLNNHIITPPPTIQKNKIQENVISTCRTTSLSPRSLNIESKYLLQTPPIPLVVSPFKSNLKERRFGSNSLLDYRKGSPIILTRRRSLPTYPTTSINSFTPPNQIQNFIPPKEFSITTPPIELSQIEKEHDQLVDIAFVELIKFESPGSPRVFRGSLVLKSSLDSFDEDNFDCYTTHTDDDDGKKGVEAEKRGEDNYISILDDFLNDSILESYSSPNDKSQSNPSSSTESITSVEELRNDDNLTILEKVLLGRIDELELELKVMKEIRLNCRC